jgi:amino acid transporter
VVKTFLPIFLAQSRWLYAWGRDGVVPRAFARTHSRFQTPVAGLTVSAVLSSIAIAESVSLGYVFGVSVRVLSAMIVFFLIGVAMVRSRQRTLGVAIMAFSAWFAIALIYGARTQSLLLQPVVQAAVVAAIGVLILRAADLRRAAAAAAADTVRPRI